MLRISIIYTIINYIIKSTGCDNEDGVGRSYTVSSNSLTLESCSFVRTTIFSGEGGVIYVSNFDLSISDSTFVNCSANNNGGAINVNYGNFLFSRCCASSCAVFSAYGALAYIVAKDSINIEHLTFIDCSKTMQSYDALSLCYGNSSLKYVNGSKTINGANAFGFLSTFQHLTFMFVSIMHNIADGSIVTIMEYTTHDMSNLNFVNNSEKYLTLGLICLDKVSDTGSGIYLFNNVVVLDTIGLLFYLHYEFTLEIHNGHFGNFGTTLANGVIQTINCISGNPTIFNISHYYKNGCEIGDQQLPDKTVEGTAMKSFEETPMKSLEETPARSLEETHLQTFEETPMRSSEETHLQTFEETPMRSLEETHLQTFEETPMRSLEETHLQTFEETPMRSSEETHLQTFEETPMRSSEETNTKTFEATSLRSLEETHAKTYEETPKKTDNNQNLSNNVLYSLSFTFIIILCVSMILFVLSYCIKRKMDETFDSENENLDI